MTAKKKKTTESAQEQMDAMQAQLKAEAKALKALKPVKPKHERLPLAVLSVPEIRLRLKDQRDALLKKASFGLWSDGESREWARISHEQRIMLMMLAGISGDLGELASRAWREFTPAERDAVKTEIRTAKRTFTGVAALCSRI